METVKCPGCNSSLSYNLNDEILKCNYCGAICRIHEEQMTDKDFIFKRLMDVHEVTCPDCGARLITDINTISTKCVYCGGSILYDEKVNKVFKPKKILLFETSLKEAKSKLNECLKLHNIKNRTEILKTLKPIYLPYWIYNYNVALEYEKDGKIYFSKRQFDNILADASIKISDSLSDKFDNDFDFSKLKNFELSLLSGHLAEEFDITSKQVYRRVLRKMEDKAREEFPRNVKIKDAYGESIYILLPFYYSESFDYQILVNGQNGNINIGENKKFTYVKEGSIKLPLEFYIRRFLAIGSIIYFFILVLLFFVEIENNFNIFIIECILFIGLPIPIDILFNDGYLLKIDENKKKYFMYKYNRKKHY